jgi:hypothetical protein
MGGIAKRILPILVVGRRNTLPLRQGFGGQVAIAPYGPGDIGFTRQRSARPFARARALIPGKQVIDALDRMIRGWN